jgi:hypothetical protein
MGLVTGTAIASMTAGVRADAPACETKVARIAHKAKVKPRPVVTVTEQ